MHSASSAAHTPCYYAGERVILSTMRLIGSPVWRPVTWKNGQGAVFSHRRMLSERDTLDREVKGKRVQCSVSRRPGNWNGQGEMVFDTPLDKSRRFSEHAHGNPSR